MRCVNKEFLLVVWTSTLSPLVSSPLWSSPGLNLVMRLNLYQIWVTIVVFHDWHILMQYFHYVINSWHTYTFKWLFKPKCVAVMFDCCLLCCRSVTGPAAAGAPATDSMWCTRTFWGLASPHRQVVLELIIGTVLHTRFMYRDLRKQVSEICPSKTWPTVALQPEQLYVIYCINYFNILNSASLWKKLSTNLNVLNNI